MTEPKAGKSQIEKSWQAYTETLEPVQTCARVLDQVVKAVTSLPPELRAGMHTTYEAAREVYNLALDAESKAHDSYKLASSQPDLFEQPAAEAAPAGNGAADGGKLDGPERKGDAKPPRKGKPKPSSRGPKPAGDQPQA